MKKLILGFVFAVTAMAFAPASWAGEAGHGAAPSNFETSAWNYMKSRLTDTRGAEYTLTRSPYPVMAELNRGKSYACWAVDMRVKSKMGRTTTTHGTYTVLFYNGRPVALEEDLATTVVSVRSGSRLASN